MTSFFDGKIVLIISPQPWDHIHVSKHEYAMELARRGSAVYFLEPPLKPQLFSRIEIVPVDVDGLNRVTYAPFFSPRLRFKFWWFYEWLMRHQVKQLVARLPAKPDVLWSFDFNLYPNFRWFGATTNIFHPVDPARGLRQIEIGRSADLILSVSEKIMKPFRHLNKNTAVIGHGLCDEFMEWAVVVEPETIKSAALRKQVGYSGNLDRPIIDWVLFYELFSTCKDVDFHLWGPYIESNTHVQRLSKLPNVFFHGRIEKKTLAKELSKMDCFLLLYLEDPSESDLSNSHKILEYLALGKVVITYPIDEYAQIADGVFIEIAASADLSTKVSQVSSAIRQASKLNTSMMVKMRRDLAASQGYSRKLDQIEQLLVAK